MESDSIKYHFTGCFFDQEVVLELASRYGDMRLSRIIACPHVTLDYKPGGMSEELLGEEVLLRIIGYGNDGKNEGFKVELCEASDELIRLYNNVDVPHITISVADNSFAKYTSKIRFVTLSNPEYISGRFAVMMGELPDEYDKIAYSVKDVSDIKNRLNL